MGSKSEAGFHLFLFINHDMSAAKSLIAPIQKINTSLASSDTLFQFPGSLSSLLRLGSLHRYAHRRSDTSNIFTAEHVPQSMAQ